MRNNPFWNMVTSGGLLPSRFDMVQWRQAWELGLSKLRESIRRFERHSTWDHYDAMAGAIARMSSLKELVSHVPLFLEGCSIETRQQAEVEAIDTLENTLIQARDRVNAFLSARSYDGSRDEQLRARREFLYWTGFSPRRADCLRLEKTLQQSSGKPLHCAHLTNMNDIPVIKAKFRKKAQDLGWPGYAVDLRDQDAALLVGVQSDEIVRRDLWRNVHRNALTQHDVTRFLQERQKIAQDGGCLNYISYLNRLNPGANFTSMSKLIVNQLTTLAPTVERMKMATVRMGMSKQGWTQEHEEQALLPWNKDYFCWMVREGVLSLQGREFSLKRVLHVIIPDLLSIGGWRLNCKPERLGRGKRCLYLYKLHNGKRSAVLYFSPYPHCEVQDSDPYQAYATILRERWKGGPNKTTPVALVGQNLDMVNNCLTGIDQLTFLAHEMGHVLHYFAMDGDVADEFLRMPYNIGELPSILLENITKDPHTLRRWSNPRAGAVTRRLDYWQRRVRPDPFDLAEHIDELEQAWLDIKAHSMKPEHVHLGQLHRTLRQQTGLAALHPDDRSAYLSFDMSEHAGLVSGYLMARGITHAMVGDKPTYQSISKAMQVLLNNVLHATSDPNIDARWRDTYGETLFSMLRRGFEGYGNSFATQAQMFLRQQRRRKRRVA